MHLQTPFPSLSGSIRWDLRDHARAMPLTGGVKSSTGDMIVETILHSIVVPFWKPTMQMRPSSIAKACLMLNAFLPDLLAAARAGRWGRCRTGNASLSKAPGGRRAFASVRTAMVAAGYLDDLPGFKKVGDREDGSGEEIHCETTCFRPTERLLKMAEDHGVSLANLHWHFAPSRYRPLDPGAALILRAQKARKDASGVEMAIDPTDPTAKAIRLRMESLNAFLADGDRVTGILFGGLRRIFNDGDQKGFKWQQGGRFYSMPGWDAYERMGGNVRAELIRLDGEEVVEVDMSAAALTILYGLLEVPVTGPEDLYAVPGFDDKPGRKQVKAWVTIALGGTSSIIGGNKFKKVREAVIARHPILGRLEEYGIGTLELQYHESEIVLSALEELRDVHGVAALPVHDCLMIPKSRHALAREVLVNCFQRYFRGTLGRTMVPVPKVS